MKINYLHLSMILVFALFSCQKPNGETTLNGLNTDTAVIETTKEIVPNTPEEILAKKEVPVLCYHRIDNTTKGDVTVTPQTFENHIKTLADSGYTSIQPAELYDYLVYNKEIATKAVVITFDDSRKEQYEIAAPIMEKYGMRGVFFVMTITLNKKNYMDTTQIAALAERGHEIGLHSWDHTMATKYKTEEDWQANVIKPIHKLSAISKKPVEYWAYPYGIFNTESAEGLDKYFKLSFILSQKRDSVYPLQSVRRIIVPDISAQSLLKSMNRSF